MRYQETIDYLYTRLPMFSRIGAAAIKPNLDNTIAICKFLGHPEKKIKTIHIAGTNGKGSTSHMLASIFQEAGYKTAHFGKWHLGGGGKPHGDPSAPEPKVYGYDETAKFDLKVLENGYRLRDFDPLTNFQSAQQIRDNELSNTVEENTAQMSHFGAEFSNLKNEIITKLENELSIIGKDIKQLKTLHFDFKTLFNKAAWTVGGIVAFLTVAQLLSGKTIIDMFK